MGNKLHINTVRKILSEPDPVSLDVWTAKGEHLHLERCVSLRYDPKTGTRRVKMLASGQIRQIRDMLIFRINGMEVYI